MKYLDYLEAHGLKQEYVEKEWGWHLGKEAIIMPMRDINGDALYNNYRILLENSDKKFTRDPGSHPSLYGIDKAKLFSDIVYCEGQPDCVRLWQEGIAAVTSDGGAGTLTEHMAAQLEDKNIILAMDSDEAGQKVVQHHYDMLIKYAKEVRIFDVPKEYKDICEMFKAGCDKDYFLALCKDSPRSVDEWRVSHMPDQHRIESLGELNEADIPDEEWILDKIVPRSGFSILAGAAAVGKSFLALDIAHSIATGKKWLDTYRVIKTEKILFIDKENERSSFRKRCRGLRMEDCADRIFRIVSPEIFDLVGENPDKDKFSEFSKDVAAFVNMHDIQLIIFDSLVDFMVGDENHASDTTFFFNNIKELFPGRSILFPAHYGKAGTEKNMRTPLERIAGSRNLGAQITSGLAIERSPDADNEIYIQSLKARNEINNTTQYKVVIHSKVDPEDETGTLVTGFELTGEVEVKVEKMTGAIELITQLVDKGGLFGVKRKDALAACAEAGVGERTANNAISEMKRSGLFETVKIEGSARNEHAIVRKVPKMEDSFHDSVVQ